MGSFNSSLFPQINALDFVQHSQTSFNRFVLNAPFLYPLKTSKNLGALGTNRSKEHQIFKTTTVWRVFKNGVFSGPYFPVFGLNSGKFAPKKTPYLDTFQGVNLSVTRFSSVSESVRNILDFNSFAKKAKLQRKLQENLSF